MEAMTWDQARGEHTSIIRPAYERLINKWTTLHFDAFRKRFSRAVREFEPACRAVAVIAIASRITALTLLPSSTSMMDRLFLRQTFQDVIPNLDLPSDALIGTDDKFKCHLQALESALSGEDTDKNAHLPSSMSLYKALVRTLFTSTSDLDLRHMCESLTRDPLRNRDIEHDVYVWLDKPLHHACNVLKQTWDSFPSTDAVKHWEHGRIAMSLHAEAFLRFSQLDEGKCIPRSSESISNLWVHSDPTIDVSPILRQRKLKRCR